MYTRRAPALLGQDGTTTTDTSLPDSSGTTTYFGPTDTSSGSTTFVDMSTPGASAPVAAAPAASTSSSGGWLSSLFSGVASVAQAAAPIVAAVAPGALSVVQQAQFNSMNAARAAKGLAPLTAAQYQQQYAMPTATVGVSSQTMQSLMWIAGGLGLAFVVGQVLKKGR
jgi:hypothetical protein